jgi:hypothetical protein
VRSTKGSLPKQSTILCERFGETRNKSTPATLKWLSIIYSEGTPQEMKQSWSLWYFRWSAIGNDVDRVPTMYQLQHSPLNFLPLQLSPTTYPNLLRSS